MSEADFSPAADEPKIDLRYKRPDGSFVTWLNGHGFHVQKGDDQFSACQAMAAEMGDALEFEPEPEPLNLPPFPISDRQFAQGLAELKLITEDEAEDWVAAGTLPPALVALVERLPTGERFPARMLLRGATRFEFDHPLAQAFAQLAAPPWTNEAREAFWRHCAEL